MTVAALQMIAAGAKILKPGGAEPDAFEVSISQALMELEMNSDLKAQLRELHITKAKEIELNGKKVSSWIASWCLLIISL